MTLTQEQIDSFSKDGYLRIGKILEDNEIEHLRTEYDREFEKASHTGRFRNLADDGKAEQESEKGRMLQIMGMCRRNLAYLNLVYDSRILDRVEDLIGPNIMLYNDQALFKPAHDGRPVLWHQDNAYWQCRPATLVSCWLTLDDADRVNGAMQVIPGSHLTPIWHEQSKDTTALLELKGIDASKARVIDLEAGGCMLHHCQTLHYTQANETDRQRRAFAIHFMQPGTEKKGDRLRVGLSHPMLRASV